jgi:hypothetical protein
MARFRHRLCLTAAACSPASAAKHSAMIQLIRSLTTPRTSHESGFSPPRDRALGNERHAVVLAELIATAALALSTLTVAAVLSIGVVHAAIW